MAYDYHDQTKKIKFRKERLEACGGRCEICGEPSSLLVIDHNQTTGQLRGMLCMRHNTGLGKFMENPDHLEAAARYLRERGTATYDPTNGGFISHAGKRTRGPKDGRNRWTTRRNTILGMIKSGLFSCQLEVAKEYADLVGIKISAAKVAVSRAVTRYNAENPSNPLFF